MSDTVKALAFAYRRRGADVMERAKLLHMLTFDLRWLSPDPAKRVLARAISAGLLVAEGDDLRANFDVAAVEIPLNFKPRDDLADDDTPAIAPPRALRPAIDTDAERERARRGGLVSGRIAALIVARRSGEDVREQASRAVADLTGAASR